MTNQQTWMDNPEAPVAGEGGEGGKGRVPHIASNIASNMSGPGIGDMVAGKRANLINKQGKPQIGRREPPPPYDPWPKRIMYLKGLLAGAAVIVAVVAVILFVGSGSAIG